MWVSWARRRCGACQSGDQGGRRCEPPRARRPVGNRRQTGAAESPTLKPRTGVRRSEGRGMEASPKAAVSPKHFSMIRAFHLADVFTLANAACGVAAIGMAMRALVTQRVQDLLIAAAFA